MKPKNLVPIFLIVLALSAGVVWFGAGQLGGKEGSVTKEGNDTSYTADEGEETGTQNNPATSSRPLVEGSRDDQASHEDIDWEDLMDTSTWKVFESEELGVRFRYPSRLEDISGSNKYNSYSNALATFSKGLYAQFIDINNIELRMEAKGFVSKQDDLGNFDYSTTYYFSNDNNVYETLYKHFKKNGFEPVPEIEVLNNQDQYVEYFVIFKLDEEKLNFVYFKEVLEGTYGLYITSNLREGVSKDLLKHYKKIATLVGNTLEQI